MKIQKPINTLLNKIIGTIKNFFSNKCPDKIRHFLKHRLLNSRESNQSLIITLNQLLIVQIWLLYLNCNGNFMMA